MVPSTVLYIKLDNCKYLLIVYDYGGRDLVVKQ